MKKLSKSDLEDAKIDGTLKLSDLVYTCFLDAGKLDNEIYHPECGEWHRPGRVIRPGGKGMCLVCDAGSVLAGTLQYDFGRAYNGEYFDLDSPIPQIMLALNDVRRGYYISALLVLGYTNISNELGKEVDKVSIPKTISYSDWDSFNTHIASLKPIAKELEDIGL